MERRQLNVSTGGRNTIIIKPDVKGSQLIFLRSHPAHVQYFFLCVQRDRLLNSWQYFGGQYCTRWFLFNFPCSRDVKFRDLSSIPDDIEPSTQVLDVRGNDLQVLRDDNFIQVFSTFEKRLTLKLYYFGFISIGFCQKK